MAYIEGAKAPATACVFCAARDADDDAARLVLHRGPECFTILNLYPYSSGHLLVVPYRHVSALDELTAAEQAELMATAAEWLPVYREVMNPAGFNLGLNLGAVAGAGITDHLHLHVVPRWQGDANFMPAVGGTRVMPEALERTYEKLQAGWRARYGALGSRR